MPYLVPLDGIRAVAILAVLVFHVSPDALPGGFAGVDVFFVLSGFLITSIILTAVQGGSFSVREFYLRRIQRLLPNLIAMVLGVYILWAFLMPASAVRQAAQHGLWALFSLSNIYIWRNLGGYWGESAESAPLTHTWSLGIEEQFYLSFPVGLLLLAKFQPKQVRNWLMIAAVLSFGICLHGSYAHPVAAFYLLPSRLWELLMGASLAAHLIRRGGSGNLVRGGVAPHACSVMGWTGLMLVMASFTLISARDVFPGWVALLPTVGTVLMVWSVVGARTHLSNCLSSGFMTGTGKLSYSLYLWHWPLITFGKIQAGYHGINELFGALAGGLAGIVAAYAVYVFIERPLRVRGPGRSKRLSGVSGGLAFAIVVSVGLASQRLEADKNRQFDTPTFSVGLYDAGRNAGIEQAASSTAYYDVKFPKVPSRALDSWKEGGIVRLYGGGRPKVVVFGSSHGLMYSRVIDDICRKSGVSVAFLAVGYSTSAFFDVSVNPNFPSELEAREFDEARKKWIRCWQPDVLFLIDRWDLRMESSSRFSAKLETFLSDVTPHVKQVVFVAQVPVINLEINTNLREYVTYRSIKGAELPRLEVDANHELRRAAVELAREMALSFPSLYIMRVDNLFDRQDGTVRYADGRRFFYANVDHLTDAGAEETRGLFADAISGALISVRASE
ncbi:MAG TPA: acyltransferase family protein [Prosthecobacter sp.]|nr:acyltransferase family protein [Prosthecobacter sp.]